MTAAALAVPGGVRPRREGPRWALTLALFLLLAILAWRLRADVLDVTIRGGAERPAALTGDAKAYAELAERTPFPCFSTVREPLFLCLGRIGLRWLGDPAAGAGNPRNQVVLRRLSAATSLLAMAALFALSGLLMGRAAALGVSLLWAVNRWDILYSTGFLREDLQLFFLLALAALLVLLLRDERGGRRRLALAALAALAGAGAAATQMAALAALFWMTVAYNLARWIGRRWTPGDLALGFALNAGAWAILSPYLIFNLRETGTLAPPLDWHAKFWRNHEHAGEAGFPTRAQVLAHPNGGPPVSSLAYVLGGRPLPSVLGRYVRGYAAGVFEYLPKLLSIPGPAGLPRPPSLAWLCLPGIVLACRRRPEGPFLLLAAAASLFPTAFILPLDTVLSPDPPAAPTGVEPRFTMPLLPYAMILCVLPLREAAVWIARRSRPAAGDAPPTPTPAASP